MSDEENPYPVSSLTACCVRVIASNIFSYDSLGGMPYRVVKPVLVDKRCTPDILRKFELASPHLKLEDQEVWQHKCFDQYPDKRELHDRGELAHVKSWRKFYTQCRTEQEDKINLAASRMREKRDRGDAQKKGRSTILINKAPPSKKQHWSVSTAGWASTKPKSLLDKARMQTKKTASVYKPSRATAPASSFSPNRPQRTHPYQQNTSNPASSSAVHITQVHQGLVRDHLSITPSTSSSSSNSGPHLSSGRFRP